MPDIPFNLDPRNIRDCFKGKEHEDIVDKLATKRSSLIAVSINVAGDFNKSTMVRNASAFNIGEMWICGKKRWDRRGALGAHHYVQLKYYSLDDLSSLLNYKRQAGYRIVGLENNISRDVVSIYDYRWSEHSVVILGEEGCGLSDKILDTCDDIVEIPMAGAVRSINVGTASGIVMFEYERQRQRRLGQTETFF